MSVGVGAGIAIAAGVGAIGSGVAAVAQSKAQKKANDANLRNATNQRELEQAIFLQSRGAAGYATLPFYATREALPEEAEGSVEAELFQYALANFDALSTIPPAERFAHLQRISDSYGDGKQASLDTVNGIFDGSLTEEAVGNLDPLADARLDEAEVVRQTGYEALQDQLGRIQARQQARGFSGDSSSKHMLEFDARRKIATDAAQVESKARIDNAADEYGIRNRGLDRRVANIGKPFDLEGAALASEGAAERQAISEVQNRNSLFSPFTIGTGKYAPTPLPKVNPVTGIAGIVGQTVATGAGAYGQYLASKPRTPNEFKPVDTDNDGYIDD